MLRLIKWIATLGCLGILVWLGLTVPLGERTLYGHLRAIGKTRESRELVEGTKDRVADLKQRLGGTPAPAPPSSPSSPSAGSPASPVTPAAPQDHLTEADRKQMRNLLDSARAQAQR